MNLVSLVTDNVTEMLIKIMEFTKARQKVLIHNVLEMHKLGFVPSDLQVDEFSYSLNVAIEEHVRSQRLVLCDTSSIKFGQGGVMGIEPVRDESAQRLLEKDPDEYLELQINKLLENSLNQRVAAELLKQRDEYV